MHVNCEVTGRVDGRGRDQAQIIKRDGGVDVDRIGDILISKKTIR